MPSLEMNGQEYRRAATHQREWGLSLIDSLMFGGDERVLDLGCGDGIVTGHLADRVPGGYVLGIDNSQSLIDAATPLVKPNLRFRLMNIEAMAFRAAFDVIFSNATLHWIHDHARLLNACYAALRPNGVIHFGFAAHGNCATFEAVVKRIIERRQYREFFDRSWTWPWFTPTANQYESLLRGTAFRDIRVIEDVADRLFPDKDAMIRWIRQPAIVPFVTRLPSSCRDAFTEAVVREIVDLTERPDGTCFEQFRRLHLAARK
ncbi:MAG: class I SAM-dependent methyltransferase [Gemmatimonadales bacterium]